MNEIPKSVATKRFLYFSFLLTDFPENAEPLQPKAVAAILETREKEKAEIDSIRQKADAEIDSTRKRTYKEVQDIYKKDADDGEPGSKKVRREPHCSSNWNFAKMLRHSSCKEKFIVFNLLGVTKPSDGLKNLFH